MFSVERVSNVLGGSRTLKQRVRTLNDLHEMVAEGLPKSSVRALLTHLSEHYLVDLQPLRDFIAPPATLKRRRTRLSPAESQRLERLARIVAMTEQVGWKRRPRLNSSHEATERSGENGFANGDDRLGGQAGRGVAGLD